MQGPHHQVWAAPAAAAPSSATVAAPASAAVPVGAASYHQPSTLEEVKTLWIGDLQYWVDENYLYGCFAHTGEVISVKIIRNKLTGLPDGYGFIEFISHDAAERILHSYNGVQIMPGTEHPFRLNWASFSSGDKRGEAIPDHSIFVGDLAPDVTDFILQETFRVHYPSVRGAKVVIDANTGRSKGYGFVKFADENEKNRAMTEMNGMFCSTRAMRISNAIPKRPTTTTYPATLPAVIPDPDVTNTTIYIGNLDPNVTEDELKLICAQIGEINYVKIPANKGCGFVQFTARASAEEAVQRLHGTVIGQQVVRLSWGRSPTNKQDPSAAWAQLDPNQWASAYYGYGYDAYTYGAAQDPSMYAYGAYGAYGQYPQQVEGGGPETAGSGAGTEQEEIYDPLNIPDVDKFCFLSYSLASSFISVYILATFYKRYKGSRSPCLFVDAFPKIFIIRISTKVLDCDYCYVILSEKKGTMANSSIYHRSCSSE
ncbi:Polyadenylate-binding protein RBP47B [Rhynchospora pubera]|uniref:Polyadenylate-binding protein RBP47B n=1 Tax=Rhynchospora pubera TaxID=906938 RepID=A0AAV8FXB5_9POAL|nr:Polyadenylate-binding protein RBP47B [Rhynchospora pubera]KAJ4795751.1 Polyadenylate-binding protein RBP47B [Rhynchospora pubera]